MKSLGHVAWMAAAVASAACLAPSADHNQYGQRHTRNQVSAEKGLADDFDPGQRQSGTREVLLDSARNVRWSVRTGSETYGSSSGGSSSESVSEGSGYSSGSKGFVSTASVGMWPTSGEGAAPAHAEGGNGSQFSFVSSMLGGMCTAGSLNCKTTLEKQQ